MHHFPTNAGNGVINYKAGNFRSMFYFRIDPLKKKGRAVLSLFDDCWWLSRDSTGDVIASRQLRLMFENHLFSAGWMQCQWPQMGRDRFARVRKSSFSNLKAMSDVTPASQCTGKKQKNEIDIDFKQAHKAR